MFDERVSHQRDSRQLRHQVDSLTKSVLSDQLQWKLPPSIYRSCQELLAMQMRIHTSQLKSTWPNSWVSLSLPLFLSPSQSLSLSLPRNRLSRWHWMAQLFRRWNFKNTQLLFLQFLTSDFKAHNISNFVKAKVKCGLSEGRISI